MEPRPSQVNDQDVYALTSKGDAELRGAGTTLTRTELEILVLVDGQSNVARIAKGAKGITPEVARATLGKLSLAGLVVLASELHADALDASGLFDMSLPAAGVAGAKSGAEPDADSTLTSLQREGYFVRIARLAAGGPLRKDGSKISIVIVDDDPDLTKMLRSYLLLEGFAPRVAANREEIVAALRQPPAPDLVLLDVTLPDADGFEVLARMRQHPALKAVPVVMLTAKATREGVLKGLLEGADGYVTKPFQIETLIQVVRAVLGLSKASEGNPEPVPSALELEGDEAKADYRERLKLRLQRVDQLMHEVAAGTISAGRLAELHRELHTLAGSADMFGFSLVARAARSAEAFLEPYCKDGSLPGPQGRAQVQKLTEALKRAAPQN
jgi:two-component system OmpR family response regulator